MTPLGTHMATEMAQAAGVFAAAISQRLDPVEKPRAIYTFARGSSDAVANILSYAFMERLRIPVTSLPPSVFSLGAGVDMDGALALIVSQSGASDDLLACAKAAPHCIAITNVAGSPVESVARQTVPVGAGVEHAVPATKTVVGSIGAGLALLAAIDTDFAGECQVASTAFRNGIPPLSLDIALRLAEAESIYVIGRQAGFGAALEVALKLKETCAIHAEAYSASEVLHGPLQLSTKPLTVLILDCGDPPSLPSLDAAERRFRDQGALVVRLRTTTPPLTPAAQAAAILCLTYPIIHRMALHLGLDPDRPATLSKVTRTL